MYEDDIIKLKSPIKAFELFCPFIWECMQEKQNQNDDAIAYSASSVPGGYSFV